MGENDCAHLHCTSTQFFNRNPPFRVASIEEAQHHVSPSHNFHYPTSETLNNIFSKDSFDQFIGRHPSFSMGNTHKDDHDVSIFSLKNSADKNTDKQWLCQTIAGQFLQWLDPKWVGFYDPGDHSVSLLNFPRNALARWPSPFPSPYFFKRWKVPEHKWTHRDPALSMEYNESIGWVVVFWEFPRWHTSSRVGEDVIAGVNVLFVSLRPHSLIFACAEHCASQLVWETPIKWQDPFPPHGHPWATFVSCNFFVSSLLLLSSRWTNLTNLEI